MIKKFDIITDTNEKKLKLVLKCLIVGIITGLVVVVYRFALLYAEKVALFIYDYQTNNKWLIPIWLIALAIMGYTVGKLIDKEPFISGSGIPQVKGVMGGYIQNRPMPIIINKFIGGTLSVLSGLSLGREGPSVQLGACTADVISKKFNSTRLERRLLLSSGASAGLSAAFNAPLSGIMFSLEEIYKYFSPLVILSTMVAAISADFIAKQFFGLKPVFDFGETVPIHLKNYWILIILGVLLGGLGAFYNWFTLKTQDLYEKIKLKTPIKMIIPFLLAGVMGLIFPVVLGGGHSVIEELTLNSTLGLLCAILIAKFLFSMASFGSGAPGGIFFPLLIIGGSIGAVFGYISINYLGVEAQFFNNFIILSMAGYFTAIVRAPITGVILITEMTGSFSHLLSLTIVSITSYIVADYLKSLPIYDSLLERLLKKNNINDYHSDSSQKIIIPSVIHFGSKIENKRLKELELPDNTLIVSLKRGENEILPKGNTIIKAGDEILVMTNLSDEWRIREMIEDLTSKE
ncbi:MAG: ClC family H(+)/Cl(-) exchange transporter [Clostridium sp.]